MKTCSLLMCIPGQSDLWLPRECLLKLVDRKNNGYEAEKNFGGEDFCDQLEMCVGESVGVEPTTGVLGQSWG